MRKQLLIIVFGIVLTFGFVGQAASAYYLEWWYVQHRVYEDGRDFNRLNFALVDESGNYPTADPVATVTLRDPDGRIVSLSNPGFWTVDTIYGGYNCDIGQWDYDDQFHFESGNGVQIDDPLIEGTYHLSVTDIDGGTHDGYFEFNGLVNLPIISSSTFDVDLISGFLLWEWEISQALLAISINHETQVRAIISIFKNDQYVGDGYFYVPTHMGMILLPPSVVRKMKMKGNRFDFTIQLRTRDNNNRTYSNPLRLP